MSTPRQILAAIFDMDGLLIDSEPLWDRAELDVMASLGVDISRRNELPDTLGLRIDMVVDLWYARQPRNEPAFRNLKVKGCQQRKYRQQTVGKTTMPKSAGDRF